MEYQKNILLRAFEALGAFRSFFDRAILEAGYCSYSRSVSGRRGCGIAAGLCNYFDLLLGAEGVA